MSEADIINRARVIGEDDHLVKDHIPDLKGSFESEFNTGRIRKLARTISHKHQRGPRVLRIIILVKLDGDITRLTGDDFWEVFLRCAACHKALWMNGIKHRDLSPGNLMFRVEKGVEGSKDKFIGILIDFDLSSTSDSDSENTERTGTIPFMALELLRSIHSKLRG